MDEKEDEWEREARKEYRMSKLQKDTINQLYMIDIMREERGKNITKQEH